MNLVKIQNFFTGKFRFCVCIASLAKCVLPSGAFLPCLHRNVAHFCVLLQISARKCTLLHFLHFRQQNASEHGSRTQIHNSEGMNTLLHRPENSKNPPHASVMRRNCLYTYCLASFICHARQQSVQRPKISHCPIRRLKRSVHSIAVKESAKRFTQCRILRRIRTERI